MKKRDGATIAAYVGAGIGFVAFVLVGAVPGLLYGGYAGLALSAAINGTPVEATLVSRLLVFGGMAVGCVATLSLFLVLGAMVGAVGHVLASFPRTLVEVIRENARG